VALDEHLCLIGVDQWSLSELCLQAVVVRQRTIVGQPFQADPKYLNSVKLGRLVRLESLTYIEFRQSALSK
jgi:hypothetical protein